MTLNLVKASHVKPHLPAVISKKIEIPTIKTKFDVSEDGFFSREIFDFYPKGSDGKVPSMQVLKYAFMGKPNAIYAERRLPEGVKHVSFDIKEGEKWSHLETKIEKGGEFKDTIANFPMILGPKKAFDGAQEIMAMRNRGLAGVAPSISKF